MRVQMNHILPSLALLALLATPALAHDGHSHASVEPAAVTETAVLTVGELEISGAFSRATLPNAPVGAGYLTIANTGTADDRLLSATSLVAGVTQIHEMKMEGDVMKMAELPDGLVIPAGGSVTLAPGGLHIMFMQLTQQLVEGTSVPVTLVFERAGTVEVQLAVGAPNAAEMVGH
jgi:copper(I)-binding protein